MRIGAGGLVQTPGKLLDGKYMGAIGFGVSRNGASH